MRYRVGRPRAAARADNRLPYGQPFVLMPDGLSRSGAYAAEVMVDGDGVWRMAMLNIGHRPTVEGFDCAPVSVEVHIIGFCRISTGHRIAVRFIGRPRDEMRFGSVEGLASAA